MEKNIKASNIDIVIKTQENAVVFEIKEPKVVNCMLFNDVKKDYFQLQNNSIVIYPEQEIIESQRCYIDTTSSIL
jgi:hypothetical protein